MPTTSALRSAVLLALIAGYVDCYSIATYAVFTSFMSGNTTQAGWNAGGGRLLEAGLCLLPIPCFVAGVFLGTSALLEPRRRAAGVLLAFVAALLLCGFAAGRFAPTAFWLGIVPLSLAMGIMNSAVTHVGALSVSLGFVTGDLNNVGRSLALARSEAPVPQQEGVKDTHLRRAALLSLIWGSFFGGALLAGTLIRLGSWLLLPAALVLLLLAAKRRAAPSAQAV